MRAEAARNLATTLFFMREELESALEHATLAADLAARSGAVALQAQSLGEKGVIETLLGRLDRRRDPSGRRRVRC